MSSPLKKAKIVVNRFAALLESNFAIR